MPEQVIELTDESIGLRGFVVIHSRAPGPAFGGCRVVDYESLDACRADAERLAEAMTWKFLINQMPGGGGKVAIMRQSIRDRPAVMRAVGDAVEALDGTYYTGPDSGIVEADIEQIRSRTEYVATEDLGSAASDGVMHALRAAIEHDGLRFEGLRVAIQGLGSVGSRLARRLLSLGARVWGADIDAGACRAAQEAGVKLLDPDVVARQSCDVFSPCGLGGVLTPESVAALDCRIVVGAANNQLSAESSADAMHGRGILWVPDFLANSGAAIRGALTHLRGQPGTDEEVARIYDRTLELLQRAAGEGRSPWTVGLEIVEARLQAA